MQERRVPIKGLERALARAVDASHAWVRATGDPSTINALLVVNRITACLRISYLLHKTLNPFQPCQLESSTPITASSEFVQPCNLPCTILYVLARGNNTSSHKSCLVLPMNLEPPSPPNHLWFLQIPLIRDTLVFMPAMERAALLLPNQALHELVVAVALMVVYAMETTKLLHRHNHLVL